jgi:large conductance mechanosensitive channel
VPKALVEFKDFVARGNVVELAVAVVIGAAFTALVDAVVEGLVTPLVGMVFAKDFTDMTFTVRDSVFRYGTVIDAVIQFVVVAAVIFFLVVRPLNKLAERRRLRGEPASEPSEETALLAEIRDLLRARGGV